MSAEEDQIPDEESQRGWADRIAEVADTWSALVQTRLAILREELAEKQAFLLKGTVAFVIGIGLAAGALLLLAALLAAVLAQLFGSVAWGIFGALVLYAAGAGVAAWLGVRSISRVRPFQFPVAQGELSRDLHSLRAAWSRDGGPFEAGAAAASVERPKTREAAVENLEERFRAGAE